MPGASAVALIPARGGSRRVPGKNIRRLGGHPLLAYTIAAARDAGMFDAVIVSTDAEDIAEIARHYGADVPFLRPGAYATDTSPDIEWLADLVSRLDEAGRSADAFALLRPTSPFRTAATIRRAWAQFAPRRDVHSLRAVEKCAQHPGKMWVLEGDLMRPLLDGPADRPWHSTPYQALPPVYVQNASLEMAWMRVVRETRTIAGRVLMPFLTEGYEGFDINQPDDWVLAEHAIATGAAALPPVGHPPFAGAHS